MVQVGLLDLLSTAVLALRGLAVLFGMLYAFRGWVIHVRRVKVHGFLVGALVGLFVSVVGDLHVVIGAVFVLFCGIGGAKVAWMLEYALVVGTGAVVGSLLGTPVLYFLTRDIGLKTFVDTLFHGPGALFGVDVLPLVLLPAIVGGVTAWQLHKFTIVAFTAIVGGSVVSLAILVNPLSGDFLALWLMVSLTGMLAQYGVLGRILRRYLRNRRRALGHRVSTIWRGVRARPRRWSVVSPRADRSSDRTIERTLCQSCNTLNKPENEDCSYCGRAIDRDKV